MLKKFLILFSMVLFLSCGGESRKDVKELPSKILTIIGSPQNVITNICQTSNSIDACEGITFYRKQVEPHNNDKHWQQNKEIEGGQYLLESNSTCEPILVEFKDSYVVDDNGEFFLKFSGVELGITTKELSILEAMVDAIYLSFSSVVSIKALNSVDAQNSFYTMLYGDFITNINTLRERGLTKTQAIRGTLKEMAEELTAYGVNSLLPSKINGCDNDMDCVDSEITKLSSKLIISASEVDMIVDDQRDNNTPLNVREVSCDESEFNHALKFDGAKKEQTHIADRLELGELKGIAINPTDKFTVSFYVHFDSFSNDNPNLKNAWENSVGGYQTLLGNYMGQVSGSGHFSVVLREKNEKLIFNFNCAQYRDKFVMYDLKKLNKKKLDYNISATFDGSIAKIYIDGQEVSSNYIGNIGGSSNIAKWAVGNLYDGALNDYHTTGDHALKGIIDNIRFYNRALSPIDILTLQNGGDVTSGLVAKYDFEGSNPFEDKTGNGHDAWIRNTPNIVKW